MKSIVNFINESSRDLYHPVTNDDLINSIIVLKPSDWKRIDTSKVTDMSRVFDNYKGEFGDISNWDVSNVKDMKYMFNQSDFNPDISGWDVSEVEDMSYMFSHSTFNGDISGWQVSKVKSMECMFLDSKFDGDISKWDISNVENTDDMFEDSPLEKNPPKWYKK